MNIKYKKTLLEQVLYSFYKPFLQHINTLSMKWMQLVTVDDYGTTQYDEWHKEVRYFIKTVVLPSLSIKDLVALYDAGVICSGDIIPQYIYKKAFLMKFNICAYLPEFKNIFISTDNATQTSAFFYVVPVDNESPMTETEMKQLLTYDSFKESVLDILVHSATMFLISVFYENPNLFNQNKTNNLTPIDYEKQIAADLRGLGFNVRTTKSTGDQGADVLASKDGVSFAIQCKMYSKPVGNKAVQEANAGRDFYKKDYGVVVSNAGFTKSARQAAHACGIILLNDNQLDDLLEYVKPERE